MSVEQVADAGQVHSERYAAPPSPAATQERFRPSNTRGIVYVLIALSLTGGAILMSASGRIGLWLCGQLLLAMALLQWFSMIHECGHRAMFRSRWCNVATGAIAGVMAIIPYESWCVVHSLHHRWTGWQDRDVTTASLVPRKLRWWERMAINVAWFTWLPLFAVLYRLENYWRPLKVMRLSSQAKQRRMVLVNIVLQLAVYVALFVTFGPWHVVQVFGLATLLTLVIQDMLILSQHTHLPMENSQGREVKPFRAFDQERFTRSLVFPRWFGQWILLNLDRHDVHHMYPSVPGYYLHQIDYKPQNQMAWWQWVWRARRIRAEVLLFQNRDQTGFDI